MKQLWVEIVLCIILTRPSDRTFYRPIIFQPEKMGDGRHTSWFVFRLLSLHI